jgi:hypothetical protein
MSMAYYVVKAAYTEEPVGGDNRVFKGMISDHHSFKVDCGSCDHAEVAVVMGSPPLALAQHSSSC